MSDDKLIEALYAERRSSQAAMRGHVIVELATITLLVDSGQVTVEQAIQRIVEVQSVLPELYRSPAVTQRIQHLTRWLRERAPQSRAGWLPKADQTDLDPAPTPDDPTPPKS